MQIIVVKTDDEYRQVRLLIEEYATLRNFDAALDGIYKELAHLHTYYPLILMAYWQGQAAGCVALQALEPGICEMKRLFVSPAFRSYGLGWNLVSHLISQARDHGFTCMRLDSHPNMVKAQELYRSFGFREIERYNQNPIPGIRFFELQLGAGV